MSQRRRYGEDLTYAEAHRNALPELYGRVGHRLDMADRDWTEFCHWCKQPLALIELVRDVGQDLNDKATTVTRQLAERAMIRACLAGWRVDRPYEVQVEIDRLNQRLRQLEAAYPISGLIAKQIHPRRGVLVEFSPADWWEQILVLHRNHHRYCPVASRREIPVHNGRLTDALHRSRLWTLDDRLELTFA